MKTIEEAAQEYANNVCTIGSDIRGIESKDINDYLQDAIYNGVEYAQQWIDVNDELPNEKNGYLDKQVLVKRFSDFDRTEIEYTVTKYNKRGWEEYSRITHWRPIDYLDKEKLPLIYKAMEDFAIEKESQLLSKIDRLESALEKIKNGTHPFNEREAFIFVDVAKQIASDALLSL